MVQWLFVYGGLMQAANRFRTIGASARALPMLLHGYQRSWACAVPDYRLTSVTLHELPQAVTAGALLAVSDDQLRHLDAREVGYERVEVVQTALQPLEAGVTVPTDAVLTYRALTLTQPTAECPITRSEIDALLGGCLLEYGPAFARAVLQTTDGWQHGWLDDRAQPRYPFGAVDAAVARQVDGLLAELRGRG